MTPEDAGVIGEPLMATGFGELKVFSGSAHPGLTREIAEILGVQVGQARLRRFPDTEVSFQIDENIRGTDVFVVQPTCATGAGAYAKRHAEAEQAINDKRRSNDGTREVMNVVGDVKAQTCIIQDDIIDTAGTITKAATALTSNGDARVFACAVHGVLWGTAIAKIEKSPIEKMIVTNTIPLSPAGVACSKIVVLSVARLLGQAIKSIHEETSVSSLFV